MGGNQNAVSGGMIVVEPTSALAKVVVKERPKLVTDRWYLDCKIEDGYSDWGYIQDLEEVFLTSSSSLLNCAGGGETDQVFKGMA